MEKMEVVVTLEDYQKALEAIGEGKSFQAPYTESKTCPGAQMIRRVLNLSDDVEVEYYWGWVKINGVDIYKHEPSFTYPEFRRLGASGIEHYGTLTEIKKKNESRF